MPGILHPYAVAALEQHAADELDGLHRAVADHDLRAVARQPARRGEVARHRVAQSLVAERGGIAEGADTVEPRPPRCDAAPRVERKGAEVCHAGDEREGPRD